MNFIYKGKHYQLPDGTTNEQAIAKIKAYLGESSAPGAAAPTLTTPAAPATPAPGPVSAEEAQETLTGPTSRFMEGLIDYTVKPAASAIGALVKAGSEQRGVFDPGIRVVEGADGKKKIEFKGFAGLLKDLATGTVGEMTRGAEDATRLRAEGDPMGASIAAAGALPVVGPPLRDIAEGVREGDYAGSAGKALGLALPFAATSKRVTAPFNSAANAVERSAGHSVLGAVGAPFKYTPDILDNIRNASRDIGMFTTREQMLERIAGQGALSRQAQRAAKQSGHPAGSALGQSERNLAAVKAAHTNDLMMPADVESIAQQVELRPTQIDYPAGSPAPGPASLNPGEPSAFAAQAGTVRDISKGYGHVRPGTGVWTTQPGPHPYAPPQRVWIPEVIDPGPVPLGEMFKAKTQAGDLGSRKGGFSTNQMVEKTPEGAAAAATHGEIGSALERLIPELKQANLDYAQRRQLADLLQTAAAKEANQGASAASIMLARTGIRGALSSTMGAGLSAAAGAGAAPGALAGATAYGMYKVLAEVMASPRWNSLSAAGKLQLADAIRNSGPIAGAAARPAGLAVNVTARPERE